MLITGKTGILYIGLYPHKNANLGTRQFVSCATMTTRQIYNKNIKIKNFV